MVEINYIQYIYIMQTFRDPYARSRTPHNPHHQGVFALLSGCMKKKVRLRRHFKCNTEFGMSFVICNQHTS
jgi:hypothetical protein